jgi:hypothetical protein
VNGPVMGPCCAGVCRRGILQRSKTPATPAWKKSAMPTAARIHRLCSRSGSRVKMMGTDEDRLKYSPCHGEAVDAVKSRLLKKQTAANDAIEIAILLDASAVLLRGGRIGVAFPFFRG